MLRRLFRGELKYEILHIACHIMECIIMNKYARVALAILAIADLAAWLSLFGLI